MIKKIMSVLLFTCAFAAVKAQVNFVRNGGFEKYSQCPLSLDQIKFANFWSPLDTASIIPVCAPEYCNECGASGVMGIPTSFYYFQYCRSGKGMAMVGMYSDESGATWYQRDYLQGKFYRTLTTGKTYCVTFYVVLAELSKYACNNIGAYIDNGAINVGQDSAGCTMAQTAFTPQILETSVIADTLNWIKIQGSFTASGNEKFITIGNFFDKDHTTAIDLGVNDLMAIYVIDDVSVIESNAVANAGPDKMIGVGDSVWIGTSEEGMPCTWYKSGSSTPIGYSGGMWVKPTATTTYVVEMDLCGHVTRDSAKVLVFPAGLSTALKVTEPMVWPNPASNELNIEHAPGCDVQLYDALGRLVQSAHIISENEQMQIGALPAGIYSLHIVDAVTGCRSVHKISKE